MPTQQQTKSNHTRIDPSFHLFLIPLTFILFVWSVVHVIRHPGTLAVVLTIAILLIAFTALKARLYALKVQDRVIRLEERLRLLTLLPDRLRPRVPELNEAQLIGLRFASDAELPALTERVLNEKLTKKQITAAIQGWRGDFFRV